MKDQNKTKAQLIAELEEMRQRVSELEQTKPGQAKAMTTLHAEKKFTDTALDAQLDTFFLFDPATNKALRWNRAFKEISGYTDEEIARMPAPDSYYSPEDVKKAEIFTQKILKEKSGTIELELICKDGSKVPTEYMVSVINNDQREPKYFISIGRDITERRQFEQSLQESRKLLRQVIDTSPYSIFVKDRDGRYVLVNKTMAESHNTSPEAMVGRTDLSVAEKWLTNPDAIERFRVSEREVTDGKKTTFTKEEKFTFQDGTERWFQTVKTPIALEDNPNCLMGIAVDITERVRAEEALRESEARMKSIFKASPIGIGLVADRILLDVNEKICEMLGCSQEELIGKSARVLYPTDEDYEYVGREKYAQIQEQGTGTVETRWQRKNGEIINVLLSSTPLDLSDLSAGVTFTALDITERVKAENALRESEMRYRTLFEHANDAIFLENEMDEVVDVNRQACLMMGYTREELLQMEISDLQAPEVRGEKGNILRQELEKYSGELFESLNLHRDGTRIPVEISTTSIPGRDDGLVMAIVRDITERKRAEREIQEYANRIEVLLEIEKAITSTLDLEEVLDTIMTELAKCISYDSISLQILRGKSLKILACRGFDRPDEVMGLVFPLNPKFPNQSVVEENKTMAIEDIAQEYPHFQEESSKYASGHIRSWLGVPLTSKGNVKGMIALDRSDVSPFSEIEIQLATAIANQAVLAIENARLFRDAQRRLERLSSLRQIDRTITGSMDLHITLNILLGHVLQQLEVDAAAVLLYRPKMQSLEFVAGQGFHTKALQSTSLRLGQGFAGQAAFDRRVVRVFDSDQLHKGFSHSPEFRGELFVAYVGVPLVAKGNIIGVLEIFHRHKLDPNPEWIEFLETLAGQAAIAIDNLQLFGDLQTSNLQLRHAYDATIEGWARALELHDPEPRGYSHQAIDLTLELARVIDIDEKQLVHIRRGVLLHDVGMMGVPDNILQKPGQLTDDEWKIIQKHPVYAYEWLAPILYLKPALDIPRFHQEKWDGTGYPHGLKGDQIPLPARIFAVVDVWLALLSDRPYRKAWTKEKAFAYIREQSGIHFDSRVVEAFIELLKRDGQIHLPENGM